MSVDVTKTERRKAPLWWRALRGTVRGTGIVAKAIYIETRFTYGVTKTRTRAHYQAWKAERNFTADDMPEIDEIPRKRRRLGRAQYICFSCNRKYRSAYGLNKHFTSVHGSEPIRVKQREPDRIRGFRATGGKIRVQPAYTAPPITKTTAARSANPMNSDIAQAMKNAWARMAEARPQLLSQIRDDMVGMEQALGGHAAQAITEYRGHLVRNLSFDPVTVQKLLKAMKLLEEASKEFSGVIAMIEDVYAADIVAARKRKGKQAPSDSTLSG